GETSTIQNDDIPARESKRTRTARASGSAADDERVTTSHHPWWVASTGSWGPASTDPLTLRIHLRSRPIRRRRLERHEDDLEQLHPAGGKGGLRAGKVQLPRPFKIRSVLRAHLFFGILEARAPVRDRPRVVQPQVFDIDDRHSGGRENIRRHLRQRGRICTWKNPPLRPGVQRTRRIAADEMQKPAATVPANHAAKNLRERLVVVPPDVFQHADRDKCVVLAAYVAIVVVNELNAIRDSFTSGAVFRVGQLLARHIERLDVDAVVV